MYRLERESERVSEIPNLTWTYPPEAIRVELGLNLADALPMPDYRYKIGQKVFIRGAARIDAPRGAYEILERLPAQNDHLRYLIRSLQDNNYKTIVDESDLA